MPTSNKDMGRRLRERRGNRTLQAMAEMAGTSPSTIQRYERGRIPAADILEKLAGLYGATVRWLLTGDDGTGQVAEPPEPYGDLERSDKRVLDDVADLLRAGDDAARSDLKRALDLVRRAARLPRKRA